MARVVGGKRLELFRRKDRIDPTEIEALAGLRPLFDPVFDHLIDGAYRGVVDVYFAAVPIGLVRPFDPDYDPGKHPVGRMAIAEIVARWKQGDFAQSWVYQKGDEFVLSDDYIIWEAAKLGQPDFLPCWILGKPTGSDLRDVQGPIDRRQVSSLLGISDGRGGQRAAAENQITPESAEPPGRSEPSRGARVPAPNVIAGILIGVANDSWVTVLGAAAVWPFVFCIYVSFMDRSRRDVTVASFAHRGRHLLMGSPILTFYVIEFATALATALPVALTVQGLKRLIS